MQNILRTFAKTASIKPSPFTISRRTMSVPCPATPLLADLTFVKNPLESLDVMDGGAYVIDLSASWCPPCRRMFPHLSKLRVANPKITFIVVSNETAAIFGKYANANADMDFTVAVDPNGAMQEYQDKFRVQGIPHCFIINKGTVVFSGHPADAKFDSLIAKISSELESGASAALDFSKKTKEEIQQMKISELKEQLTLRKVNFSDCFEKTDFLDRVYSTLGFKE